MGDLRDSYQDRSQFGQESSGKKSAEEAALRLEIVMGGSSCRDFGSGQLKRNGKSCRVAVGRRCRSQQQLLAAVTEDEITLVSDPARSH